MPALAASLSGTLASPRTNPDSPSTESVAMERSDEAEQLKDLDACNVPYALETFQKNSRS